MRHILILSLGVVLTVSAFSVAEATSLKDYRKNYKKILKNSAKSEDEAKKMMKNEKAIRAREAELNRQMNEREKGKDGGSSDNGGRYTGGGSYTGGGDGSAGGIGGGEIPYYKMK